MRGPHLKSIHKARGWLAVIRLVRDPSELENVIRIVEKMAEPKHFEHTLRAFSKTSHGRAAIAKRTRFRPKLRDLRNLPTGSVGRSYADMLERECIDPKNFPNPSVQSDHEYINATMYETHDLWHVLTGFGTDVAGEAGLLAFYSGQFHGAFSAGVIGTLLLNGALFNVDDIPARMAAISVGYQMGRKAKPLLGVNWHTYLPRPLEAVRKEFEIASVSTPSIPLAA